MNRWRHALVIGSLAASTTAWVTRGLGVSWAAAAVTFIAWSLILAGMWRFWVAETTGARR